MATYIFTQFPAANVWIIAHELGDFPSVEIYNTAGEQVEADVVYTSDEEVVINFAVATAGKAYLN
jgi:hypothetical protein